MGEHESPGQRARRLLEDTTKGPWVMSVGDDHAHEPWCMIDHVTPEGEEDIRICMLPDDSEAASYNAALMAASPDLARDLIAAEEAHEVTRAALAAALRERDEACSILDHVGIALHHRGEPHANLPDIAMLAHRDGERSRRIGPLVPRLKRMTAERDEARERVAALEAVIERVRPVVEALAAACDREAAMVAACDRAAVPRIREVEFDEVLEAMGRLDDDFAADAAWLRSLLPAARS